MLSSIIVASEVIGIVALAIYSLADNERIYASIFAAIVAAILSFLVGYQFLFTLIQDETGSAFGDSAMGWTFIMIGIMIALLQLAVIADGLLKRRGRS